MQVRKCQYLKKLPWFRKSVLFNDEKRLVVKDLNYAKLSLKTYRHLVKCVVKSCCVTLSEHPGGRLRVNLVCDLGLSPKVKDQAHKQWAHGVAALIGRSSDVFTSDR